MKNTNHSRFHKTSIFIRKNLSKRQQPDSPTRQIQPQPYVPQKNLKLGGTQTFLTVARSGSRLTSRRTVMICIIARFPAKRAPIGAKGQKMGGLGGGGFNNAAADLWGPRPPPPTRLINFSLFDILINSALGAQRVNANAAALWAGSSHIWKLRFYLFRDVISIFFWRNFLSSVHEN